MRAYLWSQRRAQNRCRRLLAYTNRNTGVAEQRFVRVDMTEAFPFLVTKLSPYYER